MRIVCRLWKTARIPLLSIGQEREPGFAQLLCGYALSEDSTFCAKLTYNAVHCWGVAEGEGKGEIVFVLHMNLIRNQFVSCDHKKNIKGEVEVWSGNKMESLEPLTRNLVEEK